MSLPHSSEIKEPQSATAQVPLSERPLVADSENTVISAPESGRQEVRPEPAEPASSVGVPEELTRRLFPQGGSTGEEAGIRIAHFEISRRLGAGGMGAVFQATDLELSREIALKILHPGSTQDSSLIARFRNEARACARLNHDNIARVHYSGCQNGLYFIAYEFARGRTLRDVIQERGQLTADETVNYAIQITLALNHLDAAGIVHRDIKPSNIMLTDSGRVKVVDLGLARRDTTDSIGDITVAGTTLGTFDYIAPEQARDPREADIRSDLYSLGCTMYHMLTGQPPYPEGTALQKLLDHQGKAAPDPRQINPAVPVELSAIIRKLMASDPAHRYPAPGLLLNDLIQMAGLLGLHSVPAEGIVWRKADRHTGRQPIGAVWMFASVLLICVTAVLLQRRSGNSFSSTDLIPGEEASWRQVDPAEYPLVASESLDEEANKSGSSAQARMNGKATDATTTETASSNNQTTAESDAGTGAIDPPPYPGFPGSGALTQPLIDWALGLARTHQTPVTTPEQTETGPFVLQSATSSGRSYRTLLAAIADARSGDLILLRFNGNPDDLPAQPPVRVVGMNLTIRAAEGFRPTLQFEAAPSGTVTPGQMISLRGQGSLTIRDVDLRITVGEDLLTERWSLFHLSGANRLQLENVSIECRNPDMQPTSLFDLTDEMSGPSTSDEGLTEISLSRVIVRADADCVRVTAQPRGRLSVRDCGLAIRGSLLQVLGDNSMQATRGKLEVTLNHVTCIHGSPLMVMNESDDARTSTVRRVLPALAIESEACVFAAAGEHRRLLSSRGSSFVDEMERLVTWKGITNLYDGHAVFWEFESSALDDTGRRMDFLQWKQFWNQRTDGEEEQALILQSLAWQNPEWRAAGDSMASSQFTPAAFELDAALFVPTAQSLPVARDGRIPGVNVTELPPFPRDDRSTSPSTAAAQAALLRLDATILP